MSSKKNVGTASSTFLCNAHVPFFNNTKRMFWVVRILYYINKMSFLFIQLLMLPKNTLSLKRKRLDTRQYNDYGLRKWDFLDEIPVQTETKTMYTF